MKVGDKLWCKKDYSFTKGTDPVHKEGKTYKVLDVNGNGNTKICFLINELVGIVQSPRTVFFTKLKHTQMGVHLFYGIIFVIKKIF